MKRLYTTIATAVILQLTTIPAVSQVQPDAEEILDRIDDNMFTTTISYKGIMSIHTEDRVDEKVFLSWGEGTEKGFSEFLSPARDKGTKYLKLGDDLWMYLPNVEKIIKISGHYLRQSMMGSDFSYEDSMERSKMKEDYESEIIGGETVDGRECYVLELTARRKDVTYYRQRILVDKERYVVLRSERYAKSGKLLKVMTTNKVEQFNDRYYTTRITMQDMVRKNSRTELVMEDIQFEVTIPAGTFTRRNLERK